MRSILTGKNALESSRPGAFACVIFRNRRCQGDRCILSLWQPVDTISDYFLNDLSLLHLLVEFTVYRMVPTTYKAEKQEDGSVLFKVISKEEGFSDELKGPDVKEDADKES